MKQQTDLMNQCTCENKWSTTSMRNKMATGMPCKPKPKKNKW